MAQSNKDGSAVKSASAKPAAKSAPAKRPGVFARFGKYLKDVRTELRRVIWPSRNDVVNSSIIVIVTLVFFMLFTLVVDGISSALFLDVLGKIGR